MTRRVDGLRSLAGRSVLGALRRAVLSQYYRRWALKRPVDPRLVVFAAYWYRGYACNPKAVYEATRRLVPGLRCVWVVDRRRAADMPPGVEYVPNGSRAYYDAIARAGVLISNMNFPDELVKRPGTIHVMTHHGTPLKYMGVDVRGKPIEEGAGDFDGLLRRVARWDYSVSSNRHSTEVWKRAYPGNYETLEVGYPRNDVLVRATEEHTRQARRGLGLDENVRTLLFAPTHRDDVGYYVPQLDLAQVAAELGSHWTILARLHYFYDADPTLAQLHAEGRVRDVSAHPSVEDLCLAADVLCTDYSSIMFDYAVLGRPIVIHAPDWEAYKQARGVYFDLLAEPPGVVTRTEAELVDALRSGRAWDGDAQQALGAFAARFCALERGDASERVVRRLWPRVAAHERHPERSGIR